MDAFSPVGRTRSSADIEQMKEIVRKESSARRDAMSDQEREESDFARHAHVIHLADERGAQVVACYLSVAPEPGTRDLADDLLASGRTVLVPVLTQGEIVDGRRQPAWGRYRGREHLVSGWQGIPEPESIAQPATSLAQADLIVVSALAGSRDGVRLGVGGGWYDRALAWASPQACVVALLNADELAHELPRADHDRLVDGFVLPEGIIWVSDSD